MGNEHAYTNNKLLINRRIENNKRIHVCTGETIPLYLIFENLPRAEYALKRRIITSFHLNILFSRAF
jgi:hypothetical protein